MERSLAMYLDFWGLRFRPFDHAHDSRMVYPAQSQQAALLKLRYVVENQQGLGVLAGESGVGKTCSVSTLLHQLPERFQPRIQVTFPQLSLDAFLSYLSAELLKNAFSASLTADVALRNLERSLRENSLAGKHAVVVVDDAQFLVDSPVLTGIRLLNNQVYEGKQAITFVLSGQTEFLPSLERWSDFDERIAVKAVLKPMDASETTAYVQHRLQAAGGRAEIFTESALNLIFRHSQGIPRRINRLGDLALVLGYAEEMKQIDAEQIAAVVEELAPA